MYRLLFDTEGNGLLPTVTKLHCIAAIDPDTNERFDWKPDQLSQAYETLSKADKLIAHHGLGFDFPAMVKTDGFVVPIEKQVDSVVIARTIYPNLRDTDGKLVERGVLKGEHHGNHSLAAWGMRLGVHKGDFEGPWDVWTPEMHSYMCQDVEVLLALWNYLKPDLYSQQALELEHRIQRICLMMHEAGWPFDEEGAGALHAELLGKLEPIEQSLRADFGFWFQSKNRKTLTITDPTTKKPVKVHEWFVPKKPDPKRGYDGEYDGSEDYPVFAKDDPDGEREPIKWKKRKVFKGYPCTPLQRVEFNPASRPHIIRCLKKLGWKPTAFTESGQPKLDDAVLEKLAEQFPQGGALVQFLLIDKRIGQIATGDQAWLKQVGPDGNVHCSINPMGTTSSRASHANPNLGQVPACKSPYGKECRRLFKVPRGWKLVGADQAGLQLRCLGHYLTPFDNGAYGLAVAEGDPHWRAVQAIGFTDEERDKKNGLHEIYREKGAKTLTYATVFGCRDGKAGSIIRDCCVTARTKNPEWGHVYERYFGRNESDRDVGGPVRERFYSALGLAPLLKKLEDIRAARDNPYPGSLPGLDGRWVPARTDHSALAALLQSAEAIICKQWVCDAFDALIDAGLRWGWFGDFVFVGWVHDELQVAVRAEHVETVANILTECARAAGKPFKFRVALSSEAKVGNNWSETH